MPMELEYAKLVEFQENINQHRDKWIFRGEKYNDDETKMLKTKLETSFEGIETLINNGTCSKKKLVEHKKDAEKDIIREFQRKLHLYTNNLPARPDILQYLALMQHHGAPTRLMDWTYSFWVAVHFAIQRRIPGSNDDAIIWAVNATKITDKYNEIKPMLMKMPKFRKIVKKMKKMNDLHYCDPDAITDNAITLLLFECPRRIVFASGSFRQNQRLTLQQGTFLIPGDVTKSFRENLCGTLDFANINHVRRHKIKVTGQLKKDVIKNLRQMNINNAVLFPGIDGFYESLWTRVGLPNENKLLVGSKDLILYEY